MPHVTGPKLAQGAPSLAPSWLKMHLVGPKLAPVCLQKGPRQLQLAPRCPMDAFVVEAACMQLEAAASCRM